MPSPSMQYEGLMPRLKVMILLPRESKEFLRDLLF